ncbi:MAG: hypothetical protein IPP71_13150 [Bacteroidetes bacterium]|nr:hypothetical protein [Bacteroidota bacterium]
MIRRFRPVLMNGPHDTFVRAQFFVSAKNVFGNYYSTWAVNLAVIWAMTLILVFTLYNNSLRNLLNGLELLMKKISKK